MLTHEQEFDTWLRAPADEAFALAREYPVEHAHRAGFKKEDLFEAA